MSNRKYTSEHVAYLAEHINGCPFKELTEKFNHHFGMTVSAPAITSLADRHGLHNGIDSKFNKGYKPTQFKKGHVPFNKNKKGIGGWPPTQFKAGHKPWNYKPIGTERVNGDGYEEVKIADPNKWRPKHLLLWEVEHGPVPKGHAVIFADGNKRNVTLDNLLLVTRSQLVRLNQNNLIQNDPDLTRSGLIIADILSKCGERKRNSDKKGGAK